MVIFYKHYNLVQSRELTKTIKKMTLNKRGNYMRFKDLEVWGLNSGFMDLRFNFGILIFDSGTKVTIFYFRFSLCDNSCMSSHQLTEVYNVNDYTDNGSAHSGTTL